MPRGIPKNPRKKKIAVDITPEEVTNPESGLIENSQGGLFIPQAVEVEEEAASDVVRFDVRTKKGELIGDGYHLEELFNELDSILQGRGGSFTYEPDDMTIHLRGASGHRDCVPLRQPKRVILRAAKNIVRMRLHSNGSENIQ